jgi:hypothetical protein
LKLKVDVTLHNRNDSGSIVIGYVSNVIYVIFGLPLFYLNLHLLMKLTHAACMLSKNNTDNIVIFVVQNDTKIESSFCLPYFSKFAHKNKIGK